LKILYGVESSMKYRLRSVSIPADVSIIGQNCFSCCKSLCEEISFQESGVKKIQIPSSVELIEKECFYQCKSLCEITFETGSSLKEIGECAFRWTYLKRIELPKKCEIISGCSLVGVKEVSICNENPFFVQDELFLKSIDKKVLIRYNGDNSNIVIGHEVEIISVACFREYSSLYAIIFESGSQLQRIEECAFRWTGVKMIQIPSSVEFIGANCFRQCHSLCEVLFESGSKLHRIEESAFHETGVKMIQIPPSVEFIGENCFYECGSLCDVIFESGSKLYRIEESAFHETHVQMIQIPSSVEFIGKNCFVGCSSLCEIIFESGSLLKEIGCQAFDGTNLKRIELPKKCEIISGFSLYGVKSVSICSENPFLLTKNHLSKALIRKFLFDIMERIQILSLVKKSR
jgi:hypothetical protein